MVVKTRKQDTLFPLNILRQVLTRLKSVRALQQYSCQNQTDQNLQKCEVGGFCNLCHGQSENCHPTLHSRTMRERKKEEEGL